MTAAALLAAFALAGCGGESPSTTSMSESAPTATSKSVPRPSPQQGQKQRPKPKPEASTSQPELAPTDPNSLPNPGAKGAAPGVPTTKGGDNSIQRYGLESGSEERIEAATTLQTYLSAQAEGRWEEACGYLAASIREHLEALAKRIRGAPRRIAGCAGMMEALAAKVPKTTLQSAARIQVLSLRLGSEVAFLIYTDEDGTPNSIPMSREGGAWKVAGLTGTPLGL